MIAKRMLSIFLAVLMIGMTLTAFPITANAADIDTAATAVDQTFTVYSADDLGDAISKINAATQPTTYAIDLQTDLENCEIGIKNGNAEVTVIGNGHTITANNQSVYVEKGATVYLGDGISELFLTSDNQSYDGPGLVYILPDSTCYMKDKVTIKDHIGNNYLGGGVSVQGGTFIMDGGTIENCGIKDGSVCYGGGVAVYVGGSFIMNDGIITDCFVESNTGGGSTISTCGGGVFVSAIASFTMNGGTISNNRVTNTGDGYTCGGGVAMIISNNEMVDYAMGNPQSAVTINNGTITGNEADLGGGVFASGYYRAYVSALGTDTPEGGLPVDPGLYINGGEISSNTAAEGGGIYTICLCPWLRGTNGKGFNTKIHNATINNNTAYTGAGIESYAYWTQMDIDGCTITGNEADSCGGGIALLGNTSSGFTRLKNSSVTNNTSGDRGAGVYYDSQSKLYISGKDIIQNNTYGGKLNNLNVLDKDYPVYVNGDLTGSQIGLSDPTLWDDGKEDYDAEAVSTEYLTSGYKANNPEVHPSEYFTSDHETWIVDRSAKTTTTQPDSSSKTRREYTAKKYTAVLPHPNTATYASHKNQYVITDITNPDLQDKKITTISDIVDELIYRFNNNPNYKSDRTLGDDTYTYYQYSAKNTDNVIPSITLNRQRNANSITIQYNMKQPRGGSITYTASTSLQSTYANSEELVLQITSREGDFSNYTFTSEDSDTTVEYVDAAPPGNVIYEYDENSDVIAKYTIENANDYKPVQATITVETGTEDEVRLVRTDVNYHINNDVIDDQYDNNDIFTSYVEDATGKDVKVGETIESFYLIPEVVPTQQNSCPYIFKGWYYDQDNENDTRPVKFGTDKYAKDIYAHWIKVENVDKDADDESILPTEDNDQYGGFDLAGVQIRKEMRDYNFDNVPKTPGGMRFVTSLSTKVVNEINKIKPNNIEYGYVAATHEGWIDYHAKGNNEKLQYVSTTANGIDTSSANAKNEEYYGFAHNVKCTSRVANRKNYEVQLDHQNYGDYLLYSFVVTYEKEGSDKSKNVLARPYIHYEDANGLERVAYSDYRGQSNTIGGCYTNYNAVENMVTSGN